MQPDIFLETSASQITTATANLSASWCRARRLDEYGELHHRLPGDRVAHRAARQALREDGYEVFFDRFLDASSASPTPPSLPLGPQPNCLPINYRPSRMTCGLRTEGEGGFQLLIARSSGARVTASTRSLTCTQPRFSEPALAQR